MAKQMKATEKGSPQTECPAGGTNPAPESLDAQLVELSAEISKAEQECERFFAIVKQTPVKIATAKVAYDGAFNAGDDVTMESARAEIRRANLDRDESAVKLAELVAPVERLRDRQTALRATALETWTTAQAELERVRRLSGKAGLRVDVSSHVGSKITSLLSTLAPFTTGVVKPRAEPVETGALAKKLACPRCLRADDVVPAGPGKFKCTRRHHGTIIFGPDGQLVDDRGGRHAGPPDS